ncbi:MAG TPA: helix-turn-helix transcriptional regulator [Steroidobacter sp.]
MTASVLPRMIGAIGETNFAAVAAGELGRFLGFDLAAIVVHRRALRPAVLFDNFDRVGGRSGIENYVGHTHRMNPMLACVPTAGVCRASDFADEGARASSKHIVMTAEEELGFRTVGWPQRMEEIGLYIDAWGGVVELGFYRARGRYSVSANKLRVLNDLSAPVAAAFDKHADLQARHKPVTPSLLSSREQEICALLLAGCSSQAIALRLDISRHTVKDHRKAIFRKLQVGSLAELFARVRAS